MEREGEEVGEASIDRGAGEVEFPEAAAAEVRGEESGTREGKGEEERDDEAASARRSSSLTMSYTSVRREIALCGASARARQNLATHRWHAACVFHRCVQGTSSAMREEVVAMGLSGGGEEDEDESASDARDEAAADDVSSL